MEARKIIVIQTKTQKKSVIMSAATTLSELKADLRSNNIDYTGMTFFEGISKIELKTDDSILPHDVPYKGQITNELVFMLTNTNKKIKSGTDTMSRAEAYNTIKSMGLQDACVKRFGKNFTQCSTAALKALIHSTNNSNPIPTTSKVEAPKTKTKKEKNETVVFKAATPVAPASDNDECVDIVARTAINKLVDFLEDNGTIEDYEKKEIINILGGEVINTTTLSEECTPKLVSSYSNDDIDNMFLGMGID